MKPLPKEIVSNAFIADNGEFGWRRPEVFDALKTIAETKQGILGGDVWTVVDGKICSLLPESKGVRMWDTEPLKFNESWSDYCLRAYEESVGEIEETQLENQVNQELRQYIYYHLDYVEQHDIKNLIPRNKHDIERAKSAVKAGFPAVAAILPELLEWLQDMNYPVAQILAPFLATIGKPLIPHIQRIFATDDELWKYWIMDYIISDSPEIANAFRQDLERAAYSPTEQEIKEELNETAQRILKDYGWLKAVS